MKSIVINLPENKERLEAFKAVYPSKVFGELTVWPAKSGKDIEVPDWWENEPNRYALAVNQMDILDSVDDDVIIFEDDCIFTDNFAKKYKKFISEVPEDADIIFLGVGHTHPAIQISENVLQAVWPIASHAVIYKKKCLKQFVEYFKEPVWPCRHYPDQRRAQGIYTGKFKAYAPLHNLCGQSAGHSDIINEDRAERWYDSYMFIDLEGNHKIMIHDEIKK